MGFSEMLWGAENWCLPNTGALTVAVLHSYFCFEDAIDHEFTTDQAIIKAIL